ncbi:MAG: hypothetical protein FWD76_06475 [Firmicutes bacterium]|nr:hypothetical protein [Bacillota bacterium]
MENNKNDKVVSQYQDFEGYGRLDYATLQNIYLNSQHIVISSKESCFTVGYGNPWAFSARYIEITRLKGDGKTTTDYWVRVAKSGNSAIIENFNGSIGTTLGGAGSCESWGIEGADNYPVTVRYLPL